ncbi:hypothetical protein [Pseudooceanicola algae]|uniref:Uncharacterized protein n=1 Tax=Pseudooceanicola algae TaxID=1537215 RepID=A0A418SH43_9RHOB|nr:hypothetical protein [Pseudooceanicola algae]QPM90371.1 hypothetical protein PSAL_016090 [Pseudooceanicola algae]
MTALDKYQRLEAAALWRDAPERQRRDVIISLGDATLVIYDMQDRPLAHWSLAALQRTNPGNFPALYHPDGDPGETLEVSAAEGDMIEALEKLGRAVDRRRPKRGRVRLWSVAGFMAVLLLVLFVWLPPALEAHALTLLAPARRQEIGTRILDEVQKLTGAPCGDPAGMAALQRLGTRLNPNDSYRLRVVRGGLAETTHLPGKIILINETLIDQSGDPDVIAGYLLAERLRAGAQDPMKALLHAAGIGTVLKLLTTGELSDAVLRRQALRLLDGDHDPLTEAEVVTGFAEVGLSLTPYARTLALSGQEVDGLIAGDAYPGGAPDPVMSDGDWLRLQAVCRS